jgi:hypothetical protein
MRVSIDPPSGAPLVTEVDESQAECGRELLGRLVAPAATLSGSGMVDVDISWTTIRLRATGDEVVAEEPHYAGDTGRFTPSLSVTCHILEMQREMLLTVGVEGEAVAPEQYVRVSRDAMHGTSVVGLRQPESEAPFTGWQMVSAGTLEETQFGQYAVRELAHSRLVWIVPLVLPTGWSFRCVGHTLVEAQSPQGQAFELLLSVDV